MATSHHLCHGSYMSAAWDRMDGLDAGLLPHRLVGGGTLWETHGTSAGDVLWDEKSVYQAGDLVACCFPAAAGRSNPGIAFVHPGHDGIVRVSYDWGTDSLNDVYRDTETYLVSVTTEYPSAPMQ